MLSTAYPHFLLLTLDAVHKLLITLYDNRTNKRTILYMKCNYISLKIIRWNIRSHSQQFANKLVLVRMIANAFVLTPAICNLFVLVRMIANAFVLVRLSVWFRSICFQLLSGLETKVLTPPLCFRFQNMIRMYTLALRCFQSTSIGQAPCASQSCFRMGQLYRIRWVWQYTKKVLSYPDGVLEPIESNL
jgi:hypothetical protein